MLITHFCPFFVANVISDKPTGGESGVDAKEKTAESPTIEFSITHQYGSVTRFRVTNFTRIGKVFKKYADRLGVARNNVEFVLNETLIEDDDKTVIMLGLDSGAVIHARVEGLTVVKVRDANGWREEMHIITRNNRSIGRVFAAFCKKRGVNRENVRFFLRQKVVENDDFKVSALGLDESDCFEARPSY